jgi:Tol biopolymer transport system component
MRRGRILRRVSLVLAIATMAATILLVGGPARATFPGQDGRIAFWDYMTGQIYTMNPDGTALVQATHVSKGHTAADPAWSPDGTKIAFDSDVSGQVRLWVMGASGSHPHQLTGDLPGYNDFVPSYTPDGRSVVFARCRPDPPGGCAIYSVRTDGTHQRAITPFRADVADFRSDVSPDGTRIAFDRFGANGITAQVYVMQADGSGAHALTPPALEGFSPGWSPDGRRITFSDACCKLNSNVYAMHSDGTGIHRLTDTPFPNNNVPGAYSPQGDRIVFASDRRYNDLCCTDLFMMRSSGAGETLIPTGHLGAIDPVWGTAPLVASSGVQTMAGPVPSTGLQNPDATWCRALPEPLRAREGCGWHCCVGRSRRVMEPGGLYVIR